MARVMQAKFPRKTLEKAVEVADALWNQFAGDPTPPHDVAMAIDSSPTSSHWRLLSGAAKAYGLTDGGYGSEKIGLADLGQKVVAPTEEGQREEGLRQALLRPDIMRKFYTKYDRKNFPRDDIAQNVLANEFDLPKERTEEAVEVLKENGKYTGVLRDTGSSLFVALDVPPEAGEEEEKDEQESGHPAERSPETAAASANGDSAASDTEIEEGEGGEEPKPIFIGHGKNHGPLKSLKEFLTDFDIPFRVVEDEAHLGRPISSQVKEGMESCGSAIIIFTKDEKFYDEDGNEVWRPSENVIHELGAALFAFDERVVIFKEEGLELSSNYKSIGHIPFEADNFQATTKDLLKELVGFDLVQVTPT